MLHRVPLNLKAYSCCVAIKKRSQKERRVARTRQLNIIIIKQHPQRLASQNRFFECCYVVCCPSYIKPTITSTAVRTRAFLFFYFTNNPASTKVYNKLRYIAIQGIREQHNRAAYSKISRKIPAHTEW